MVPGGSAGHHASIRAMAHVLLISNTGDIHTDLLVDACAKAGLECFRLNTDHYRRRGSLTWRVDTGDATLAIDGHDCCLGRVGLIVYRRPIRAYDKATAFPQWQRRLLDDEWKAVELAFSTAPCATVVNPVDASALARNKLIQLQFAKRAGLRIPATLISTANKDLATFASNFGTITKGIDASYAMDGESVRTGFTKRVTVEDLGSYDSTGCPTLLQELIRPQAVWRVVAVGHRLFSVRYVGESLCSEADSRLLQERLSGAPTTVPEDVAVGMRNLCGSLAINFASSDFVEDTSGRLYFVDLNPDGQWAWLQDEFGLGVADAVIQLHSGPR